MIKLFPVENADEIKARFSESGIEYTADSGYVTAKDGDEELGFCLYNLTKEKMTVLKIEPQNDLMMADGILRSTLHVAAERFVLTAEYENTVDEELLKKLGFVKNEAEKTLDTDKLFKGCNCKK